MKEIVIKLPDKAYENIQSRSTLIQIDGDTLENAVLNGTLLPKEHGRLGDLDKIADKLEDLRDDWNCYGNDYESGMYKGYDYSLDEVIDAPTIIEAESEE